MYNQDDAERLVRIETMVESMNSRLFGNGQPGMLAELDSRVDGLEKTANEASGAFKMFAWVTSMVLALVAAVGGFHIFGNGKH